MKRFPVLISERLALREFEPSDAPAVFDMFSRDEVTRYYSRSTMRDVEQAEAMVAARAELFPNGWGTRWAITLQGGTGEVIGSCGYYNVNKAFRSVEIGYDLHPDHWSKGIMTEALDAMLGYTYSEDFFFPLNRVEALTELENEASIRVLMRLGFREEGVRRQYGYWRDAFHDVRSFSLLRAEWAPRDAPASGAGAASA